MRANSKPIGDETTGISHDTRTSVNRRFNLSASGSYRRMQNQSSRGLRPW
jgi:hypothetical protein